MKDAKKEQTGAPTKVKKKSPITKSEDTISSYKVNTVGSPSKAFLLKNHMINAPWEPGTTNLAPDPSKYTKEEMAVIINKIRSLTTLEIKLREFAQKSKPKSKLSRKERRKINLTPVVKQEPKSKAPVKKKKEIKGNTKSPYDEKYFENKLKEKRDCQNLKFKSGGKDKPKYEKTKKVVRISEPSVEYLDKLQKTLSEDAYLKWLKTFTNHSEKKKEKLAKKQPNGNTFVKPSHKGSFEISIPLEGLDKSLKDLREKNTFGAKCRPITVLKKDDKLAYLLIGPLIQNTKWRSPNRTEERAEKAKKMNYVVWEKKGSIKKERIYNPTKTLVCIIDSKKHVYRIDRKTAELAIAKDPTIEYVNKSAWKSGKKAGMSFNTYDLNADKTPLDRFNEHIIELKKSDEYHHGIRSNRKKRKLKKQRDLRVRSYFKQQTCNSHFTEGWENAETEFELEEFPTDLKGHLNNSKPGQFEVNSLNKVPRTISIKDKQPTPESKPFVDKQAELIKSLKKDLSIQTKKEKKAANKRKYATLPINDGLTCKQRREAKYKAKRALKKPLVDAQTNIGTKVTRTKKDSHKEPLKSVHKNSKRKVKQNIKTT